MSTFHERKAERIAYYEKYVNGWKLVKCSACNGSGYYDHNGSPPCGGCDGTGRERVPPDDYRAQQAQSSAKGGDAVGGGNV